MMVFDFPILTLGQRKGLGLGGAGEPWFVVDKCAETNSVFVERGDDHPALYRDSLWASELNWIGELPSMPFKAQARVRHRQALQEVTVHQASDQTIRLDFDKPQRAVTLGQSAVIYLEERCLGGGEIIKLSEKT